MKNLFSIKLITLVLVIAMYSSKVFSQSNDKPEEDFTPFIAPEQVAPVVPIQEPKIATSTNTPKPTPLSYDDIIKRGAAVIKLNSNEDIFRPVPIHGSKELEPYIEQGMRISPESIESGSIALRYQNLKEEERQETNKYIIVTVLSIIVFIVLYVAFMTADNKLTGTKPTIKNIDEETLKQNLNFDNSQITEIDSDTLRQKLGV